MRCPNCNQWNRSSLTRCFKCGAELGNAPSRPSWSNELKHSGAKTYIRIDEDGQADVTPDRRDELAIEMTELKTRKDDGEHRLQQLMTEAPRDAEAPAAEDIADIGDLTDDMSDEAQEQPPEPENPFARANADVTRRTARVAIHGLPQTPYAEQPQQPPQPQQDAPRRRITRTPRNWHDGAHDPMAEEREKQHQMRERYPNAHHTGQHTQSKKMYSRRESGRRIVNFITCILVIVVLGLAGAVGFSAYRKYLASRDEGTEAIVTASMKDDQAAHTILIPGEDGQRIYIHELHATYEVVGGFATIVIPDYTWYSDLESITAETLTVTLTPALQTSGARQRALDPITYEISIPESPIELISPEHNRIEVTTAMYTIELQVRPGSSVTIENSSDKKDISDSVDEKGRLIYNATVQPKGDNVYHIVVRSPYCRDNSIDVVLYREAQEIPLDLDVTTYTSTSLDKYQITCTTLPGAEVDILTPHTDLVITKLDSTGEFSFYAIFDKVGYNTVSIQATYPGKKTSRVDYTIYYLPSADVYTRKAWSLMRAADYAELMGNITYRAEKAQIYFAMGTFDSFVSESPQMGIMYCSEDGLSQPVLLQNETKNTWEPGKEYRIYADVYGTYNGMPWLIVRYSYAVVQPTPTPSR